MESFESLDLPKVLQQALDDLGFVKPTPIQAKSFSTILSGRDVMGIAQTGTGKTFAYLLPILKQWKFSATDTPRVVILVPTRELVVQVTDEVKKLCKYMSVRVLGVYGGVNIKTHRNEVFAGVDILVGTPGRLMDLALEKTVRFDSLQKLIIDEFDEILNLGFRFQLTSILSMLKNKRQNILFSATMTEEVDAVLDEYFNYPVEISLAASGTPLEKIKQYMYQVPSFLTKLNLLQTLVSDDAYSRILIFANNKKTADMIHARLENDFPQEFGVLHSNKSQNYRLGTMRSFEQGKIRGIITTDIMARGLDISGITHVINVEFPDVVEKYIHRIGRTGRADKEGIAISFIGPKEEEFLLETEVWMHTEMTPLEIPEEVEFDLRLLDFEKDKIKQKPLPKKPKEEGGAAFHEKSFKNKKVNLGGPTKRKPKKTKPVNRAAERKRASKGRN